MGSIIAGVSTKLSAAIDAFAGNYERTRKQVDYDQWLLRNIGHVTVEDALHALVTYLIPLFESTSNLAVTCPSNKLEEIGEFFRSRGWDDVQLVPEDKLCKAFAHGSGSTEKQEGDNDGNTANTEKNQLPETISGASMFLPGAFATKFKCACPRCDIPDPDDLEKNKL